MWGAIKAIGSGILGALTGGSKDSTLSQVVNVVGKHVEDVDKRNELVADLSKSWLGYLATPTVPWVDALDKSLHLLLWFAVIGVYLYGEAHGTHFDVERLAMLMAGPGVVTLTRKGR